MSEDERALRARLAALEAEVQAEAEAKAAATPRREPAAPAAAPRATPTSSSERSEPAPRRAPARDRSEDLSDALALARRAADVKHELTRERQAGDKSWAVSTALSFFFGPVGWLYAGSFREAAPAALAYVVVATVLLKILPSILMMPMILVALPLSALGGLVYALSYNRAGKRQRLFGKDADATAVEDLDGEKRPRALPRGSGGGRGEG